MTPPRTHVFAAAILGLGAGLIGITALAVVAAQTVLGAHIPGVVAHPGDVALLGDLVAVSPFFVTFAAFNLAAAIGLLLGRRWAVPVASWVASVAVAVGLLTLVLSIAGGGLPAGGGPGPAADADGLWIVSLFVSLYAAAAVAVRVTRVPSFTFDPVPTAAAAA